MKPLNRSGVCRYRGGCEHRQFVHDETTKRLVAALAAHDPLPCGHTPAEHAAARRMHPAYWSDMGLEDTE